MRTFLVAIAMGVLGMFLVGCPQRGTESKSDGSSTPASASPASSSPASPPPQGTWDAAAVRVPEGGIPCGYGPEALALPPANGVCDEAACKAAKGTCVWGGFGCVNVCALLTTDVGKKCSDFADCQGSCLADKDVKSGATTTGTCSPTMVGHGCSNTVRKGVAGGYMCGD